MPVSWAFRRAYASMLPVAKRTVVCTRIFGAAVSTSDELSLSRFSPSFDFSSAIHKKQRSPNESLVSVIKSEIKCARKEEFLYCAAEVPDGFPFEIHDNPGERTIVLKRVYEDETIEVKVDMPDKERKEEDGDNNADKESDNEPSIPLVVNVLRKGMCLQFGVTASPDNISIHSMSVKEDKNSENKLAYGGPEFKDLDKNLQKNFQKYLEVRGFKPSTANVLLEYMIIKDSREYYRWLKNLKKFAEK